MIGLGRIILRRGVGLREFLRLVGLVLGLRRPGLGGVGGLVSGIGSAGHLEGLEPLKDAARLSGLRGDDQRFAGPVVLDDHDDRSLRLDAGLGVENAQFDTAGRQRLGGHKGPIAGAAGLFTADHILVGENLDAGSGRGTASQNHRAIGLDAHDGEFRRGRFGRSGWLGRTLLLGWLGRVLGRCTPASLGAIGLSGGRGVRRISLLRGHHRLGVGDLERGFLIIAGRGPRVVLHDVGLLVLVSLPDLGLVGLLLLGGGGVRHLWRVIALLRLAHTHHAVDRHARGVIGNGWHFLGRKHRFGHAGAEITTLDA